MYDQINSLDFRRFLHDLAEEPATNVCRRHLAQMRDQLRRAHTDAGRDHPRVAVQLIQGFAFDLDTLVLTLWRENQLHLIDDLSLIATGGYGRMELHPFSDIDLLVIHKSRKLDEQVGEAIAAFVRGLWDCGLKVGSSIRSLAAAKSDIGQDVNLLTSLLESRQLTGKNQLHVDLLDSVYGRVSNSQQFLKLKLAEQQERHARFDHVSYLLEPNIKNSPGSLRDVHCIYWHSQVAIRGMAPEKILEAELISHAGMHQLIRSRNLLISVRLGLHLLAGKPEERLLIDYQRELASRLGYKKTHKPAVEEFMQRVYKALLVVSAINDSVNVMLKQRLSGHARARVINKDFYARGDTLMCHDTSCFRRDPGNLLLCFKLIAQNPNLRQLSGECISAVYENSLLIDDVFRHNPLHKRYFLDILGARCDVSVILEQMKRFGVLGRYLEVFGGIIGQLQHDLVHVFTVDAHTIRVLHNLHNLLEPAARLDENLRIPSQVAGQLPEFPLLLMAGLFHDIAKGRGGNHSQLGAVDARHFAREHTLPDWQVDLLAWLVEQHLLMSATAQQQDVDDPRVIERFATGIGDKLHLDYLYVLTVADIMSTNPSLWNAWRAALLTKLYQNSLSWLSEHETYSNELIESRKQAALTQIPAGLREAAGRLWEQLPAEFFQSKSADNLVLHSTMMVRYLQRRPARSTHSQLKQPPQQQPQLGEQAKAMLLLRPTHSQISLGATELSVFCASSSDLFARITACLAGERANVLEARVFGMEEDGQAFTLISCILLDEHSKPIPKRHYSELRQHLAEKLAQGEPPAPGAQLLSSRVKKFWFVPHITFNRAEGQVRLNVECIDFPGLLALIVAQLHRHGMVVQHASVTTLGDRARDSFILASEGDDLDQKGISAAQEKQLCADLHQTLAALVAGGGVSTSA